MKLSNPQKKVIKQLAILGNMSEKVYVRADKYIPIDIRNNLKISGTSELLIDVISCLRLTEQMYLDMDNMMRGSDEAIYIKLVSYLKEK